MTMEKLTIGNVNFDKECVLCSNEIYENGLKLNYVFLIGGTKIMFPDQEGKNSTVTVSKICEKNIEKFSAWFNNIKGLIIDDAPHKSDYFVYGN